MHARGWLRRLAADELHAANLVEALGQAWEHAATWLGRSDDTMMATLLFMAPVIGLFFAAQRAFVEGVTLTGVKG